MVNHTTEDESQPQSRPFLSDSDEWTPNHVAQLVSCPINTGTGRVYLRLDSTVVLFRVLSVDFCGIRVSLHELSAILREHTTQAVQH